MEGNVSDVVLSLVVVVAFGAGALVGYVLGSECNDV